MNYEADNPLMQPFEPEGVYAGVPYRVLPDGSIEAMMPGGLVKFKDLDQFLAVANSAPAITNVSHLKVSYDLAENTVGRNENVHVSAQSLNYFSILTEAIQRTAQNSAQLRALVYERARFNLKREALYGYSSIGLADLVRHINDFELAVARIEANSIDDQPRVEYRKQAEPLEINPPTSSDAVQILLPEPIPPLVEQIRPIQLMESLKHGLRLEGVGPYSPAKIGFIGIAFIGAMIIAGELWRSPRISPQLEITDKLPQVIETPVDRSGPGENSAKLPDNSPALSFPLPTSFGIFLLSDNKLIELEALPIKVPDGRVTISAEITSPSITKISDNKPAFILFRRDLINSAPQRITLRVVARMAQETKIIDGKATVTATEGAWRIRNTSRELKVSPIAGHPEMILAHLDESVTLAAGRYVLDVKGFGYDFTIEGTEQSLAHCLERFEAANGAVLTECRTNSRP